MFIKICGLKTEAAVKAAVDAGADALGFVFADSPRRVTPEHAATLTKGLPSRIVKVAVMLRPAPAEWSQVLKVFTPDWLQAEADDFELLQIPASVGRLPVYRDSDNEVLDRGDVAWPEHVLFEGARSGAGMQPNWDQAAQVARQTCMILAGGLTPENVQEAILRVHPWGVDVSSGVEVSPGVKDHKRIAAFVAAAREVEGPHAV